MVHDVFISYASKDKAIADAACAALEAAKIRCWIAPRDIHSGENWVESITRAIKASRVMVLIFTESSNQSKQVAKELTLAVNSETIVVPFKIDDILPSGVMEYYLSDTHWLDAINPPTEKQIYNLVETVKYILGDKEALPPTSEYDRAAAALKPAGQVGKTGIPPAGEKKEGLVIGSILAAALLLFGILYFSGVLPDDKDEAEFEEVEAEKVEEVEAEKVEEIKANDVVPLEGDIIVTSTKDSGEGTLRRALQEARPGDVITFDPWVFPPNDPATIYVESNLPPIYQGNITIDASNAGVILDGSRAKEKDNFLEGLWIESPDNVVMGLQIVNFRLFDEFMGAGILLIGPSAQDNIIGGDRTVGAGPIGQGNLLSGNDVGIDITEEASNNVITGNLIGTDASGNNPYNHFGNEFALIVDFGAFDNIIGPGNVIAFNYWAVVIGNIEEDWGTTGNTVTRNSIYDNFYKSILLDDGGNLQLPAPKITEFDLEGGTVKGTATAGCTIEIFTGSCSGGETYEGSAEADENGNFSFSAAYPLSGPNITATATDPDGNTSEFSAPATR